MVTMSIALSSHRLHLIKKVVDNILKGNTIPNKIIINYSNEPFFIDKGIADKDLPEIDSNIVEYKRVPNIGPMRIVFPMILDYWDSPEDIVMFWDDDLEMSGRTVEDLLYFQDKLDCVVGLAGYTIGMGKYLTKAQYWGHKLKTPQKVHILFNGWGTTFKIKHIHEKVLEWEEYKDLGLEYTNEAFIMACFALKGIDRYVIPSEMIKIYTTEDPIHINPITMAAEKNTIKNFFDMFMEQDLTNG